MFERYTEKARRLIFFARYEASQYGSPSIETEHLLLGMMREDHALLRRFLGPSQALAGIRAEVERHITPRERISTSVEVPLTSDCKKILNLAAEEADRLAHRYVRTEHVLLGILRVSHCLAAQLLTVRGAKAETIREQLVNETGTPAQYRAYSASQSGPYYFSHARIAPELRIDTFVAGFQGAAPGELADFFGTNGRYIDSNGKCWLGHDEIAKHAGELFAPFAKRNATFRLGEVINAYGHTAVATVLWEFAVSAGQLSKAIHRMSIVLAAEGDDWSVLLVQVTPVIPGPALHL